MASQFGTAPVRGMQLLRLTIGRHVALASQTFMNLRVGWKLLAALGWIMAITLVASTMVIDKTLLLVRSDAINTQSDKAINYLADIRFDVDTSNDALRDYLIAGNPEDEHRVSLNLAKFEHDVRKVHSILAADAPKLLPHFAAYVASARRYNEQVTKADLSLAQSGRGHRAELLVARNAGNNLQKEMDALYKRLSAQTGKWGDDCNGTTAIIVQTMLKIVVIASTSLIGGCFLIAWLIGRTVSGPLKGMTDSLIQLANGDRDVMMPAPNRRDEIGDMARAVLKFQGAAEQRIALQAEDAAAHARADSERQRYNEAQIDRAREQAEHARGQAEAVGHLATGLEHLANRDLTIRLTTPFANGFEDVRGDFNASLEQLGAAIDQVGTGATAIWESATQVNRTSDQVSTACREQADRLQSTADALRDVAEDISGTSRKVVDVQETIDHARIQAGNADRIMDEAVTTMQDIADLSSRIASCTSTIEGIASSTCLLALNATIEAARAGDHGRGFSVVATEVRALAQQATAAAQEIEELNQISRNRIQNGVRFVQESGRGLADIITKIETINTLAIDIAGSASHQANALTLVSSSVDDIDRSSREQAVMTEQATRTVQQLAVQATALRSVVGTFKRS